jgi:hypothetical protein
MPRRSTRVRGTRVTITIPPNIEQLIVRGPGIERRMALIVEEIASRAQQTVPTGTEPRDARHEKHLKDTEAHAVVLTPTGLVGVVAYFAYWAHMVHDGTSHSTPNPWLLNAALSVLVRNKALPVAA